MPLVIKSVSGEPLIITRVFRGLMIIEAAAEVVLDAMNIMSDADGSVI